MQAFFQRYGFILRYQAPPTAVRARRIQRPQQFNKSFLICLC